MTGRRGGRRAPAGRDDLPRAPDPRLLGAERALEEGRLEEASAAIEGWLRSEAPPEAAALPRALLLLGRAHGRAGRFFEALVAARRLLALEEGRGAAGDRGPALALLVVALLNAKAPERAAPVLEALERELAARAQPPPAELERVVHQARATLALLRGEPEEAERRFAALERMLSAGRLPAAQAWLIDNGAFHVALARRDVARMEALLARVLAGEGEANVYVPQVTLRLGLAQAHLEQGRVEAARAQATAAARALLAAAPASEVLVDDGAQLVGLLAGPLHEPALALGLAEAVSGALVARLGALEASAAALGGLAVSGGQSLLGDLRADLGRSLLDLLEQVQPLLPVPAGAEGPTVPGWIPICAWCHAVRLAPGRWLALQPFTEGGTGRHVTHGICPDCARRARGR